MLAHLESPDIEEGQQTNPSHCDCTSDCISDCISDCQVTCNQVTCVQVDMVSVNCTVHCISRLVPTLTCRECLVG